MKNTFKRALCVLLAVLLLFGMQTFSFAEEESKDEDTIGEKVNETDNGNDGEEQSEKAPDGVAVPVIYIDGQADKIYSDKNDIESKTYPTKALPDGALRDIITSVDGELLSGMVTGKWVGFCNALYNALVPVLEPLALDENGNPTNETGYDCLKETEITDKAVDGRYGLLDYRFIYDWRLDPYANAVELDAYIRSVKAATGAEKVDLVAAGLGYSTLLAYFCQFGEKDVKECILYSVGINGIDAAGALFSGQLTVDDAALNRYIQENLSDTDIIMALSQYAADLVISNGFADSLMELTARIYKIIYTNIVPRLLISSFATMPGYWSVVGEKYYADAKKFIFSESPEMTKDYTVLLKRIDRFHNEVLINAQSILNTARKNGVNVYNIVKYSYQVIPVYADCNTTSDGLITISAASPGVISAPIGEKLSDEYIAAAEESGSVRFISPDAETDASTGMLPMHTWYIKLLKHGVLSAPVEKLMESIFNFNGYTSVFGLEAYPQYLVCNKAGTRMEALTSTGVIEPTFREVVADYFTFDSPTGVVKKMFILVAIVIDMMRSFIELFTSGDPFRP